MVDLGMVSAGLSSLIAIKDIAQGLNAANTQAAVNEIKIELQGHVINAQSAIMAAQANEAALIERVKHLEQEAVRLKDWATERERYEPVDIYLGTIAYMAKLGMENGEPPHWLCANCFQKHTKSFLAHKGQTQTSGGGRGMESKWGCDTCSASLMVSYRTHPDRTYEKRVAGA